ncbi:MAG: sulfite exporter TauE/SafE family protein [Burkholderiales bacterium]|nr:sulfite exporter TauE/SafE family protein [Burkholderiales bacterium]
MLTVPLLAAAASAGLLGGVHCAGMCGGIAAMLSGRDKHAGKAFAARVIPIAVEQTNRHSGTYLFTLHAGRLTSYALMGAVVGLLGGTGMLFTPSHALHVSLLVFGNLALIWLGLHIAGYAPTVPLISSLVGRLNSAMRVPRRHPFATGMAWGCLPCGLLYSVLPFALLSGSAWSGAVLMLVFGLTALPYLLFTQWASSWRHASIAMKRVGAVVLIGFGVFGLWHVGAADAPNIFCLAKL